MFRLTTEPPVSGHVPQFLGCASKMPPVDRLPIGTYDKVRDVGIGVGMKVDVRMEIRLRLVVVSSFIH